MERVVERCAGLDVHKDTVVACVRVPDPVVDGGRRVEVASFGTTTVQLLALRDWLTELEVTRVGMESTGVYWKPPYHLLEDAFECWLLNAAHLKNVPGRKTDVQDAVWIAQLVEHGLVRPSFVPPKPVRTLRVLTRYRRAQVEERVREVQRLDKLLQDAGVKLSSVASRLLGVSCRQMLDAMVAGTTDPAVLAELAKGTLRRKLPALREALTAFFTPLHALVVGEVLAKIEYLEEAIERLSAEVDKAVAPFARELALLVTIPGVQKRTAEAMLAEFGADMTVFGTAGRLASWAGRCPGQYESAGRSKGGRTRQGPKWLRTALHDAARAATTTKGTYLSAQYRRIKPRRGARRARVAVEHSILVAAFHMLTRNEPYNELGADYFTRRQDPDRRARRLLAELGTLGYEVVATPRQPPAPAD